MKICHKPPTDVLSICPWFLRTLDAILQARLFSFFFPRRETSRRLVSTNLFPSCIVQLRKIVYLCRSSFSTRQVVVEKLKNICNLMFFQEKKGPSAARRCRINSAIARVNDTQRCVYASRGAAAGCPQRDRETRRQCIILAAAFHAAGEESFWRCRLLSRVGCASRSLSRDCFLFLRSYYRSKMRRWTRRHTSIATRTARRGAAAHSRRELGAISCTVMSLAFFFCLFFSCADEDPGIRRCQISLLR